MVFPVCLGFAYAAKSRFFHLRPMLELLGACALPYAKPFNYSLTG